jgi:hypothetical protein
MPVPRTAPRCPPARLARAGGLLTAAGLRSLAAGTLAMAQSEMRKLRHDQLDLVTGSAQPLLWLSSSAPRSATTAR